MKQFNFHISSIFAAHCPVIFRTTQQVEIETVIGLVINDRILTHMVGNQKGDTL